jgi:hypothetical protein
MASNRNYTRVPQAMADDLVASTHLCSHRDEPPDDWYGKGWEGIHVEDEVRARPAPRDAPLPRCMTRRGGVSTRG